MLIELVTNNAKRSAQINFVQMPEEIYDALRACGGAKNAQALYLLGVNYAYGFRFPKDLLRGYFDLSRSLELGDGNAVFLILHLISGHEELQKARYLVQTIENLDRLGLSTPALNARGRPIASLDSDIKAMEAEARQLRREKSVLEAKAKALGDQLENARQRQR